MTEYSNQVDLSVKAGEDYTCQMWWQDYYGEPIPVLQPLRMEIRTNDDQRSLVAYCEDSAVDAEDTLRGYLSVTSHIGLVEVYLPKGTTSQMQPGTHVYDLFAPYDRTVQGESQTTQPNWGSKHLRMVASGLVHVHPRVTQTLPTWEQ